MAANNRLEDRVGGLVDSRWREEERGKKGWVRGSVGGRRGQGGEVGVTGARKT